MITKKKMFPSFIKLSQLISKEMYDNWYGELICGYWGGFRLYLGIETVSCRLLLRDGKGAHGLNLAKVGPFFFQVLTLCPAKKHQKSIMVTAICYDLFDIFFLTLQDHFLFW